VQGRLLLNVVVGEGPTIFELLAREDKALLIRGDALLVLDLGLDIVDRVTGLDFQSDGFSSECLDKDLHASSKAKDEMEGRLLLDVIIRESAPVLELLAGKDEALLVRGDALFVLNLRLDVIDGVAGLDLQGDSLSGERLYEDLHSTAETKDEMEGGLLLDIVIRKGSPVFELFAGKDETLLIRRNTFLVLDLRLHVVDSITGFDLEGDGLASQSLNEDLHRS